MILDEFRRQTEEPDSHRLENELPLAVSLPLRFVDWPINLDGKSLLMAIEVEHEAAYGMLPPELTARQGTVA
jgi:hypothetical protein